MLLALLVCLIGIGGLLVIDGLVPAPVREASTKPPSRIRTVVKSMSGRLTRRRRLMLIGGVIAGIVLWAVSGWIVYLVALPVASLALPMLLDSGDSKQRLERLDALESWTRSLAGLTLSGMSLEQVISASRTSAPEPLRKEIDTLVARLAARWKTRDALEAFANDLDDPTADLIVAHLLLTESIRGPGLTAALEDLAAIIFEEVKVRRQIESDRAKPRQNMRIITLTTLALLAVMPFLATLTTFMTAYQTPIGQLLLAVWLALYALILVWMKRVTMIKRAPRILGGQRHREVSA